MSHTGFAQGNVFSRFVDRKIDELERLVESCQTEMVEVRGTRDALIDSLVTLFDEMRAGDTWTTLTTPAVWQHEGLGLDGRYSTATEEVVKRGASIQRTYAISIEEIGAEWAESIVSEMEGNPRLEVLRLAFKEALRHHAFFEGGKARSGEFRRSRRDRFVTVLQSLDRVIDAWELGPMVDERATSRIDEANGLYLGLKAAGTLVNVRELRSKNPVSLMHLKGSGTEPDKWLLVMTDIRGRNEYDADSMSWPQLRGIRVYKSVRGIPKDRINALNVLMAGSVNIGPILKEFVDACIRAKVK